MTAAAAPAKVYITRCTGTRCYGRTFAGRLLRCPACGSTLVTYHGGRA